MPQSLKTEDFVISREFNAPLDVVWAANTECKHLMHWWGPKGSQMFHCKIDFRVGGVFHYGMRFESFEMWGKFIYSEIVPKKSFTCILSFSDKDQGVTVHPMSPTWPREMDATTSFAEKNGKTTVTVRWHPHNATQIEIDTFDAGRDSMKQGFGGSFDMLEAYLAKQG